MGPDLVTVDRGIVEVSALEACLKLSLIKRKKRKMLYGPGNERSFILSKKNKLTSASHPDTLKRDWKDFEPGENSDFSPSGQRDKFLLLRFFQSNIYILSKKKPAGQGCEAQMCLRRWWWRGQARKRAENLILLGEAQNSRTEWEETISMEGAGPPRKAEPRKTLGKSLRNLLRKQLEGL